MIIMTLCSGLHDTTEGLEFKNEVFLRSFDTKYVCCYGVVGVHVVIAILLHNREEDIEGDVISNPTADEDDPQTKVKFCSDVSINLLQS